MHRDAHGFALLGSGHATGDHAEDPGKLLP
jgi:hypothetical protein